MHELREEQKQGKKYGSFDASKVEKRVPEERAVADTDLPVWQNKIVWVWGLLCVFVSFVCLSAVVKENSGGP